MKRRGEGRGFEAERSKEKKEKVLDPAKAIFTQTTPERFYAAVPKIVYDIVNGQGDVERASFLYDPNHPDQWTYEPSKEDALDTHGEMPDQETTERAIYEFQNKRDLSRRGVEVGDSAQERLSDLAFLSR